MTLPHDYRHDPDTGVCACTLPRRNQVHQGLAILPKSYDDTGDRSDESDAEVIDRAIRGVAAHGKPFSANDVRPLLQRVKAAVIGQRFRALIKAREIRPTNQYVPSTDKGTKGHRIAVYVRGASLRTRERSHA